MRLNALILSTIFALGTTLSTCAQERPYNNDDFVIKSAEVTHNAPLGVTAMLLS